MSARGSASTTISELDALDRSLLVAATDGPRRIDCGGGKRLVCRQAGLYEKNRIVDGRAPQFSKFPEIHIRVGS
jgi:hypothetical protein